MHSNLTVAYSRICKHKKASLILILSLDNFSLSELQYERLWNKVL